MRTWTAIILTLIIGCTQTSQTEPIVDKQTTVIVYNDPQDDTTVKYNQAIMALPEYQNWNCNQWNSQIKTGGHAHFEKRNLLINGHLFYHIELISQRYNKPIDSFIHPEVAVCYFRVDLSDEKLKILNEGTGEFIELMTKEGRDYFQKILKNKSCPNKG